ncbi:MAG: hypothetical protein BGO58_15570 [Sphingopyxis sp. 65-8]|jgi:hypothetical protein|nr:MAG: hypothetical protein BGO58_15570 [Sphingopyxis sp. 65-8]
MFAGRGARVAGRPFPALTFSRIQGHSYAFQDISPGRIRKLIAKWGRREGEGMLVRMVICSDGDGRDDGSRSHRA